MDDESLLTLKNEIAELEQTLADKKRRFEELQTTLADQATRTIITQEPLSKNETGNHSPPEAKIALFRSLFKGGTCIIWRVNENALCLSGIKRQ